MGCPSSKRGRTTVAPPLTFLPERSDRGGRNKGGQQQKAAFDAWKTDTHSAKLKEWQAQSKKHLRQWMLEKERHQK
jgi:hypothetical protein